MLVVGSFITDPHPEGTVINHTTLFQFFGTNFGGIYPNLTLTYTPPQQINILMNL